MHCFTLKAKETEMRSWLVVFILALALIVPPVLAQSDTPVPTPSPEVFIAWTEPAYVNDAGTPVPGQDVQFGYVFNSGDEAIALPAALILISLWAMGIIVLVLKRGGSNAGGA